MGSVLELSGVGKYYGDGDGPVVTALDGVDLAVAAGEFVAVMGPSGCGKSTLLAIAGGLEEPSRGEVTVAGHRLSGVHRDSAARLRRDHIGYVFQDYNLIGELTVVENVALPRELAGASVRDARAEAVRLLDSFGLPDLADRFPDQLSGGQRQRAAIARALTGQRRLLLADEPTGALDSESGAAVMDSLRRRVDEGVGCVLVTHDDALARRADRVVRLRDGRVVADAAVST